MTGPPWNLTLRVVHTEPPAIHQLQYRFPYSGPGFCRGCYFWDSSISWDSLYLPVGFSNFGLPCDFTSLMNLRRVIDFSVCSAFDLFVVRKGWQLTSFLACQTRSLPWCILEEYFMVVCGTQDGVDMKKRVASSLRPCTHEWGLYNQKMNERKAEEKRNKIRNKRWRGASDWKNEY